MWWDLPRITSAKNQLVRCKSPRILSKTGRLENILDATKISNKYKRLSVERQTGKRLLGDHGIGCKSDYHRESRNEKT